MQYNRIYFKAYNLYINKDHKNILWTNIEILQKKIEKNENEKKQKQKEFIWALRIDKPKFERSQYIVIIVGILYAI